MCRYTHVRSSSSAGVVSTVDALLLLLLRIGAVVAGSGGGSPPRRITPAAAAAHTAVTALSALSYVAIRGAHRFHSLANSEVTLPFCRATDSASDFAHSALALGEWVV